MQFRLLCIRVNHCQFILVPEEVSFYEPETFSCTEQMDPDNFIRNGSTEFHANTPHNPAEKCIPAMVTTRILLGPQRWGNQEQTQNLKANTLLLVTT